jgi:MFS family permease
LADITRQLELGTKTHAEFFKERSVSQAAIRLVYAFFRVEYPGKRSRRWPAEERSVPNRFRRELGLVLGWLIFPVVPVVLEDLYFQVSDLDFSDSGSAGPDPRVWGWFVWILMLGPLLGYAFLAGATMGVPDDDPPPRGRVRRLLGRRVVWVAIGPWWGAVLCIGLFFGLLYLDRLFPGLSRRFPQIPPSWKVTWIYWLGSWALSIVAVVIWAYSWLWPAWSALRRAKRAGEWKSSLIAGIVMAGTFVGSLFGSFWAVTAVWRSYFFDPRIVRLLVVALSLTVMSGCASTITYGEVRRRELFHALLVAWVLGLALMWRWWSRSRGGRPPAAPG